MERGKIGGCREELDGGVRVGADRRQSEALVVESGVARREDGYIWGEGVLPPVSSAELSSEGLVVSATGPGKAHLLTTRAWPPCPLWIIQTFIQWGRLEVASAQGNMYLI